jgi:hypothetical protein
MNLEDTLVAVSSPAGAGERAIIRLSGPRALEIADAVFVAASDASTPASRRGLVQHDRGNAAPPVAVAHGSPFLAPGVSRGSPCEGQSLPALGRAAPSSRPGPAHALRLAHASSYTAHAGRLEPPEYPHGVFRHKDLESARKQRESWDLEIARRRMIRRKTEKSKPIRKNRA